MFNRVDRSKFKAFDLAEFHIAGISYLLGNTFSTLAEGDLLKLSYGDNHSEDYPVILIIRKRDNALLGYVPNKGYSCYECNGPVKAAVGYCTHCGSDSIENQGLAYRIGRSGILEEGRYLLTISSFGHHEVDGLFDQVKVKLIAQSL